jgi:hypothetical protein
MRTFAANPFRFGNLEAEIKAASIVEKIQRRLRDEHDAFTHGAAVLQIITQEIYDAR